MATICTDAGHGGHDSGAVWQEVLEKDMNLRYTISLNAELKNRGHRVFTTRQTDSNVSPLRTRCQLINEHHRRRSPCFDAIISIHCNVAAGTNPQTGEVYVNSNRRGFYAIYSAESNRSHKLARLIARSCGNNGIHLSHKGKLSTIDLGRTLAWIHRTLPPATLLELGFMTNPEDLNLLRDDAYHEKMVQSIADGIETYLGN